MIYKTEKFPKASRPLEYVAFFTMEFPTKEGPGYVFLACDAYTEFAFNTGVEPNDNPETILKHIYLLTEHPDFICHVDKGIGKDNRTNYTESGKIIDNCDWRENYYKYNIGSVDS